MERKVTISDPALDQIIDAVVVLSSLVGNLHDMVYRHRHFTLEEGNPDGGVWTKMNDSIREADLASVQQTLSDIRIDLEDLKQS
jgi:hypothetical protein